MEYDDYWIPRNLDAPALMFMWEADVAILFLMCFFLGAMMQMTIFGLILGLLGVRALNRIKEEGGYGLMQRALYWYTPSDAWLSEKHPSHIREFVGE